MEHVTSTDVKATDSVADSSDNVIQESSKEQRMYENPDYTFTYSTPNISGKNDIQGNAPPTAGSLYSIDSGFSDATFDLTRTSSIQDSSQLSAVSSPESEAVKCRRHSLQVSEFSPITRGYETNIPGRRLTFHVLDIKPLSFQQLETDQYKLDSVECSQESIASEEHSFNLDQTESKPLLASPLELCQSQSFSSPPHSIIEDDFEVDFQEMVLDKSSSNFRTSPLQLNSEKCDFDRKLSCEDNLLQLSKGKSKTALSLKKCSQHESDSSYVSQANDTEAHGSDSLHSSPSSLKDSGYLELSDTEAADCGGHSKVVFLNKLSLTPEESEKTVSETIIQQEKPNAENAAVCNKFPDNTSTSDSACQSLLNNFRLLLHQHKHVSPESTVNQFPKCDKANTSIADNAKHLCNSPNKRSGVHREDVGLLFSPTKIRKTHESSVSLIGQGLRTHRSPQKHASRKILTGREEESSCFKVKKADCKYSKLCCAGPDFSTKTLADLDSEHTLREQGTACRAEAMHNSNLRYHLFLGGPDPVTPDLKLFNNFSAADSVVENLYKVITQFSPCEPTRLIGRNIGIRKFDIVQELYSQNFYLCLEKIFHHVSDTDLFSIANVSTCWNLAICGDYKAYSRYRQYKKDMARTAVQSRAGKENHGEKVLDVQRQPLTKARSLLSSMQTQAQTKTVPEPPPKVTVQETLTSDDTLRICPRCQSPAVIKQCQDRATCTNEKCSYDFCTLCFSSFHHPRQCKPLCKAPSKGDVAGTKRSKKNLKRL